MVLPILTVRCLNLSPLLVLSGDSQVLLHTTNGHIQPVDYSANIQRSVRPKSLDLKEFAHTEVRPKSLDFNGLLTYTDARPKSLNLRDSGHTKVWRKSLDLRDFGHIRRSGQNPLI